MFEKKNKIKKIIYKTTFMTLSYFFTGSYQDQDTDFELTVFTNQDKSGPLLYRIALDELGSQNKILLETSHHSFESCLNDLADFIDTNGIRFYGKNRTSAQNDTFIDNKLQNFIYSRSPENL